jgi:hypothetical protein
VTLPLLGLALGRRPPSSLVPLLVAACRWCRPVALDPAAGRPSAVIATPAEADHLPRQARLALWAPTAEEAATPAGLRAVAIVSDDRAVVEAAGVRGVFAATGQEARGRRLMPPFLRARLRAARGLTETAVLEQTPDGWLWAGSPEPLTEDLVATAMASASAVAVRDPDRLLEALAWGSPCVSDGHSAAATGALAGREVLVAEEAGERSRLASQLAGDAEGAASLSWAGRRFVERWHDATWAALRLVDVLGLRPLPQESPAAVAALELGLLGTLPESRIAARLADAAAYDR